MPTRAQRHTIATADVHMLELAACQLLLSSCDALLAVSAWAVKAAAPAQLRLKVVALPACDIGTLLKPASCQATHIVQSKLTLPSELQLVYSLRGAAALLSWAPGGASWLASPSYSMAMPLPVGLAASSRSSVGNT